MTAQIISGSEIASKIKKGISEKIAQYVQQGKRKPGLAVILVGADPASQVYVGSKRKSCGEIELNRNLTIYQQKQQKQNYFHLSKSLIKMSAWTVFWFNYLCQSRLIQPKSLKQSHRIKM